MWMLDKSSVAEILQKKETAIAYCVHVSCASIRDSEGFGQITLKCQRIEAKIWLDIKIKNKNTWEKNQIY